MTRVRRNIPWLVLALATVAARVDAQTPLPDGLYGKIHTPKGTIVIQLELERTPMTVANFVGLAEGTIQNDAFPLGTPFFDGSTFHRVVAGHVIQGGVPAPDSADGSGTQIPNEIDPALGHGRAGMVGMANAGPHTATNQFYITLGDRSYLDGDYTVFGEVVQGMDVVMTIVQDDQIDSVRIVRVGERAEAFHPTTASFRQLVATVEDLVRANEARKHAADMKYVRQNWPTAVTTDSGWSYVILDDGSGTPIAAGDSVTVRYAGHTPSGLSFASSDGGTPNWPEPGAEGGHAFVFVVGTSAATPAFDDALAHMRRGERRLVIVPVALAYGTRGYYAPSQPNVQRFVISPNTMLIYVIEIP